MNVARYLFQSPYSSPVQFGRPDPSVKSDDENQNKDNTKAMSVPNETLANAKSFNATQIKEVQPVVESSSLLDIYA